MSRTNLNFVIAYIFLVGLPVLGLAGVLRAGRTLTAPVSVDGVWKVDADAAQFAALPCFGPSFPSNLSLSITQSGRSLVLNLNSGSNVIASGSALSAGFTIKGSAMPTPKYSAETGCGSGSQLSVNAVVDAKSDPRTLMGTMTVDGCSNCAAVGFHAVRQVRNVGEEGR
jgi:hypothetical protein